MACMFTHIYRLTLSTFYWESISRNKISHALTVQCVYDVLVFDVDMMETAFTESFFNRTPFIIAQARRHLNDTEFWVIERIFRRLGDAIHLLVITSCAERVPLRVQ